MKLICAQNEFNTHLSIVSRVIPSRPSHPVLANVLLVADVEKQQVRLTGFDLSLGIQTSFSAQIEAEGTLTLPAKLLGDIVSRLPDGEITLETSSEDTLVSLTSVSGKYQVRGMGAEEFPELPTVDDGQVAHLPVDALIEGLRGALFSTSADETKQVLTGVHISAEAEGLEFAATDGHRLAVVQTIDPESDAEPIEELKFNVTVPGKALRELERMLMLNATSGAIAVRFDPGQLVFEWANQRLTSRLLEGQYPNYRQLIPRQFSRQLTVDRRSFSGALERIAVIADQRNSIVKLSLDSVKQELVLSVDAQDVGNGREAIAAQISGEDLDIAFNVKYLVEGLKALNTQDVQMQFNTSTSPSILTPLGGMKMTYLVMPVQIRS
ncbi:MAG: DNA polymerase III subunit beta [Drouetiella hepatica Uher 2000/2452]|jgi:DNA polymerase-3 subunit beta|uniref:Beta sliding clamp n=1 Tax=Drouetiella hepatica Uher 2000/2452 TaxID=904376 RepID=A0A951UNU7_9CYAN|nr:DNA polymerase III subunit beta [Drouetiella hepatica Uher 2000/2452]